MVMRKGTNFLGFGRNTTWLIYANVITSKVIKLSSSQCVAKARGDTMF